MSKSKNKTCLYCGKPIVNRNKYCNQQCKIDYEYHVYIKNWQLGKVNSSRGAGQLSVNVRRYLFEKYNSSCALCGWSKINTYTKKIPLEVEHVDGNSDNNIESNLIILCPNCHSLTSTYKGANRGNGRYSRRQRYKIQKSY